MKLDKKRKELPESSQKAIHKAQKDETIPTGQINIFELLEEIEPYGKYELKIITKEEK